VQNALNGQGASNDIRSCYPWLQAANFETLLQTLTHFLGDRRNRP